MSFPPRESATVIVLRDGAEGLELFMVRRHARSDDFAGAFVFPGGLLDEADCAEAVLSACTGVTAEAAGARLGLAPARALGHMVAAIRETFEEAGVLLAGAPPADRGHWSERRRQLLDGERGWAEIVQEDGLKLDCGRLGYFSHWITPEAVSRRFTTRFFVAELPEGQAPLPDAREVDHGLWVTPKAALGAFERGEMNMIFPTLKTLEELAGFERAAEVLAACAAREVTPRLPRAVRRDGETVILLPGDPGYDGAEPESAFDPKRR